MEISIRTIEKDSELIPQLVIKEFEQSDEMVLNLTTSQLVYLHNRAKEVHREVVDYVDTTNEVYQTMLSQIQLADPLELTTIQATYNSLAEIGLLNKRHVEYLDEQAIVRNEETIETPNL